MLSKYSDFMQRILHAIDEYGYKHGCAPRCIIMNYISAGLFDSYDNTLIKRSCGDMYICGIVFENNNTLCEGQFLLNNSLMRNINIEYHKMESISTDAVPPHWELYYVRADGTRVPGDPRIAYTHTELETTIRQMIRELGNDYAPQPGDNVVRYTWERQEIGRRYSLVMRELIENGYYLHGPERDDYIKIAKIGAERFSVSAYVDKYLKFYCVEDDDVIPAIAQKYGFSIGTLEVMELNLLGDTPFPKPKYHYVPRD